MMWTISIILAAMCFGGILDCTGMMASVAAVFLKVAKAEAVWCFDRTDVHHYQRGMLRPVFIPGTAGQNVQGIFRGYAAASGKSFQMSGRRGYDYI